MEKRVTMKDIAAKLKLSINAVSLALNSREGVSEGTRKLVLQTAEEMGYLARNSKYNAAYSNRNLCILLENRFFKDMQFYGRILLGLEEAAKKAGYDIFVNSFEGEQRIPPCIEQKKVAGIIVVGMIADEFLIRLKSFGLPVVLVDHTSQAVSTDSILSDNKSGTYRVTRYLLERGFERIGYFGGVDYSQSVKDRFLGYQEAMQACLSHTTLEESMHYLRQFSCLYGVEEFVIKQDMEQIGRLFQKIPRRPEAVICSNDKAAILLCKALERLGYQIPRDISIVGFDDIELCKMVLPGITTVRVDKELMGKKAMDRLLKKIENPKEKVEKIILDVRLIERGSVRTA